ncbi:MAG: class I SAM-dependent methyltransferase [Cyanobacteriota bacterium]
MEYSEVEQKIKEVEGYLVEGEDRVLFEKAKNLPDYSTIIEIGSFKGKSSVAMGYACEGTNKLIYCIDPWIAETYFEGTKHEKEDIYNIFLKNRNDNNLQDYLIDIKDYSTVIMPNWKEIYKKPADLVFIDGDHSFKGVTNDFIVAYPHVKEGGMMIFQDVATYFEGCEDFWYNIGSKKLINHSYFHSLAMGIKPFFKDTLEYKAIEDFIKQKNYTIASQLLKALSFDYPYSIELKIIDSINDYNNNSFSESKYKLIKILEENTNNLPLIYEIYNSFFGVDETYNYLTNIINIDKKIESKSLEIKENNIILDILKKNNEYLFSCVVINEELNIDYLKRTIKNILTQKYYSSIEIIVLNNEKIHHSFLTSLEKENNIQIISFNENSKVENYNKALKMAKGKYLKIFTVYEIIKNDFFEKILSDFTINQDSSVIYYDFFYCDKTVDDLPYNNYKINSTDVTLIPEITDIKLSNQEKCSTSP